MIDRVKFDGLNLMNVNLEEKEKLKVNLYILKVGVKLLLENSEVMLLVVLIFLFISVLLMF